MKAIKILTGDGRPIDKVEQSLKPDAIPITVAWLFCEWIAERACEMVCEDGKLFGVYHINPEWSPFSVAFNMGCYLGQMREALEERDLRMYFFKARMLALLMMDVRGFGSYGRRERIAQVKQLLKLCKQWEARQ